MTIDMMMVPFAVPAACGFVVDGILLVATHGSLNPIMQELSTRNLALFPSIVPLKKLLQTLATLDAILCPEWDYRYFSFNSHGSSTEQMASMRNGQGDSFFALFNPSGCFLKGFGHESPMSPYRDSDPEPWPALFDELPDCFTDCLTEPAFDIEASTFCIWNRYANLGWQLSPKLQFPEGVDPDGSADLLYMLDGNPEKYIEYAIACYEKNIDSIAVEQIYNHQPLNDRLIQQLNADNSMEALVDEIVEIGYPIA
ncbi:MAG: hypothetical protein HC860_19335 [Alkalinema sp. RU_4_3]|nr:hypothetical protein [Alkalinema sp. RU_4_3]